MAVQYLHLWFLLKLTLVAGQTAHYVLKDEEAILTPALKGHPDNILWRHNGNKAIEFDGAQETVYKPFEERITLAWDTAKLAIANVRYEDSGEYELDAFIRERLYRSQYLLKVLDKISMPLIRCEIKEESGDGNNTFATLFCSSESNTPEALTFKWNLDGKSHVGPDLPITLGYGHDDITYSCTVNNPLQEETSTFTAKDCYTERTVERTETLTIVLSSIFVPLMFLLVIGIGIVYKYRDKLNRACCKRGKNDDCENPPEKNRGVKRDTNDTDERVPLMPSDIHRQETILSPQRLPIQEEVDETPIKGIVKDRRKIFESPESTEAHRERHVPAPRPGPGRKDSERELRPQDAENVPKPEEEGDAKTDSDQNENKAAPEPQSPNDGPQVKQDLLLTQKEQEGTGQTDSEKKSDERHKDNVGVVGASSSTQSTEQPGKEELKRSVKDKRRIFESPKNTEANRERHVPEPTPGPGRKGSGGELSPEDAENVPKSEEEGDAKTDSDQNENKDAPEPQSPNDGPQVKQDLLLTQEEQEGTGQTDSEKKSDERHKDNVGVVGASSSTPATEQPGKEELKRSVKDKRRIFESPKNTEANRGRHMPEPTPGRKDSERELRPQDAENVPKSEKEGDAKTDSDQNENKDAPEPQSPNNGPQVKQDLLLTQEEQEGTGQTDSEKKSDECHKDNVGVVGASSSTPATPVDSSKPSQQPVQNRAGKKNTNDKDDCPPLIARDIHQQETILSPQKLEVDDLKGNVHSKRKLFESSEAQRERRVPEATPGPGRKDSGVKRRPQDAENVPKSEKEGDAKTDSDQNENKDAPELQSPNDGPQVKQDLLPMQEEQEGTGQTDSESDERHEDHENEQTTEASKAPEQPEQQSTKSETQVNQDQPAPEEQEHRGQTDSETSNLDESSKAPEQPGPQPAVSNSGKDQPLDSGPSGDKGKGHEASTTLGEEQQKQDSSSNKSKESTSNAETETPESEEQFDESTHPPASSSSHHADNKETKDTDGELTAYSNPPHDDQTRDDTDKESDSSGTEKRNGDKMESGEAVVDMDHKNSKA